MHNRAPGKQFVRTYSILMVLWIGFIFWNSLHSGAESAQSSNFVLEWLRKIPFLTGLDGTLVRKGAHFTEFAMLGALAAGSVPAATFAKPLFCALLTAVSDETIQLFVEGRSSAVLRARCSACCCTGLSSGGNRNSETPEPAGGFFCRCFWPDAAWRLFGGNRCRMRRHPMRSAAR